VVYGLGPLMKHDPPFLTVPNLFCLRAVSGQPLTVSPGANRPIGFLHLADAVRALRLSATLIRDAGSDARPINAVSEVLGVGEVAAIVEREATARGLTVAVTGAGPLTSPRWSVTSSLDAAGFCPTRTMQESLGEVMDFYARRQETGVTARKS
jgi:nucleoside-diphosphate-sugar epimerase